MRNAGNMNIHLPIYTIIFSVCAFFCIVSPTTVGAQEKAEKKHYSHESSKGKTYYLFSREQSIKNSDKVITMYYFAKDPNNTKGKPVADVPDDRMVSETKNGLLVLKKKPTE